MRYVEITYRYETGSPPQPRPADALEARARLDAGSRAFAALLRHLGSDEAPARRVIEVDPADLGLLARDGAPAQRPFAAVLGCSDARVPVELIFNEGPNDLFVVRVAGNGLGSDVLGSLKYAIDHLGESLKLVVVLGHSGCGALTAAVDVFLDSSAYLGLASDHMLRALVDRKVTVVHACSRRLLAAYGPDVVKRAGYREALVELSTLANAALSAHTLQQELGLDHAVRAVYGVYVLSSREVWAPRAGSADVAGLADPPRDAAGFVALADTALASERMRTILGR